MYNTLIEQKNSLYKQLWETELGTLSPSRRHLIQIVRLFYVVIRELSTGQLTLHAMSLVYTTLISLVPLLAVSFSVLKAFKVQGQVEPFLIEFLAPLGAKGLEVSTTIIGFIDNMNVGVLGGVGLSVLFYTVVSLIQKIEQTFNHIWHIDFTRGFLRRAADYLSVLMIGPVMVVSALALTASMVSSTFVQYIMAIDTFGTLLYYAGLTIPYLMIIAFFTFMYMFIPNTRVNIGPALIGATLSGILWKTAGMLFASFTAGSTQYDAIYSGFAILIMFMIWLYLSWLIFLLGSQVAFYCQHPEYVSRVSGDIKLSSRQKEKLTLMSIYCIGKQFYLGGADWTIDSLSAKLAVPSNLLVNVLAILQQNGLVVATAKSPCTFVPAKDLDSVLLCELLHIIRNADDGDVVLGKGAFIQPEIEDVLSRLDKAYTAELGNTTVREWISE
ncbi:MAG: membrane protein [Paraglaciecola sp.]